MSETYTQQYSSTTQQQQHASGGQYTPSTNINTFGGPYTTGYHSTVRRNSVQGAERTVGYSTRVDEKRGSVLSERIVEHEIKVPKKRYTEETIEKVVVIPEKIMREEIVEETQIVQEKIIEVANPIIQERIVEVPEYIYVDKVVEVVEKVYQEKIREVPKVEIQERLIEVPKVLVQEKIVEVPEVEFREIPYETIVEMPEIREQVVVREVPIPQYIDKPVPEYVTVEVPQECVRNLPVPVEAISTFEYKLPQFKSRVNKVQYPIYVPRFIEVPVAQELFDGALVSELQTNAAQVALLKSAQQAVSLCEVENLATTVRRIDIHNVTANTDFQAALSNAWQTGQLGFSSMAHHSVTNYPGPGIPRGGAETDFGSEHRSDTKSRKSKSRESSAPRREGSKNTRR